MAKTKPESAAMVVVTAQSATMAELSVELMARVDPGLNLYQPTQRVKVPRTWRERL
jgi:hypothetical protein